MVAALLSDDKKTLLGMCLSVCLGEIGANKRKNKEFTSSKKFNLHSKILKLTQKAIATHTQDDAILKNVMVKVTAGFEVITSIGVPRYI